MWARTAYAAAPWASSAIPVDPIPGEVTIPPPIPDATTTYTIRSQTGTGPWAWRSWAGAVPVPYASTALGGISVAPDPAAGVMQLWTWWPDAPAIQIVRITQDGTRTPVRGGYPRVVVGATRRNRATNPSVETGLNGYVAGAGTPTLTRIARTDDVTAGQWALRAEVAAAGTDEVTVPHNLTVGQVTIGVDLRLSALPTGVTITLGWNTSTGAALTASSVSLTSAQYTASVGQWMRHVVTLTPPVTAAQVGSLKIAASGMPAGGQMDLDRWTAETAITDGSYVDGTTLGGAWSGTPQLSMSVVAPVQTLADGECPLDTPVIYEVYYPAVVGGRAASQQAQLDSGGRTWLTHPLAVGTPMVVDLRTVPTLEHDVEQGVFYPLDSAVPIVVSGLRRRAATGTLAFNAISRAEYDALMDMFADVSPVLLRSPADYHYAAGYQWVSLGRLTEDREARKAWQDAWLISAPFYEVAAPDPALAA